MRRLLVVDDDERLRALLSEYLTSRGFGLATVADGKSARDALRTESFDLVVLDLSLPDIDGLELLRELRRDSRVPVLILTARGDETDRIVGLEIGADDYLGKPFNPRELVARINAVLRRVDSGTETGGSLVRAGEVSVDAERRLATIGDQPIDLTTTEFEILRTLVANAGRVIPREQVMRMARGEDFAAFERSVDVHISHLRKKLNDDPKSPRLIKTIRGIGYTMPKS